MFNSAASPQTARPRLEFLDGLRGLCALYIALYHAVLFTGHGLEAETYAGVTSVLIYLLSFGPYSVAVFIVLSGFCLGLPVAVSPERTLRGGFKNYIGRRARRILPPYYAALVVFLLLIALVPVLQTPAQTAWDSKIPVTWDALVSHLLLLHNIYPGWMFKIDGPMWSVATEWQIYFLFPALLVLWRRFGLGMAVGAALVVSILPQVLLPSRFSFGWLHPWFFGLFALGLAGAVVVFSPDPFWARMRRRLPWCVLAFAAMALLLGSLLAAKHFALPDYLAETLVGLAVCTLTVYYALAEVRGAKVQGGTKPFGLGFLGRPRVVFLGAFSYSIYLIHSPLLGLLNLWTLELPLSSDLRLLLMLTVGVPLALLCSYVFYALVERHFLTGHQRALQRPRSTELRSTT